MATMIEVPVRPLSRAGLRREALPVWYTLVLAPVLLGATLYGLVVSSAYVAKPGIRSDFSDVMRGQDVLTLFVVPIMIRAAFRARRGSFRAHQLWLGIMLYVAYSYVMYAVSRSTTPSSCMWPRSVCRPSGS